MRKLIVIMGVSAVLAASAKLPQSAEEWYTPKKFETDYLEVEFNVGRDGSAWANVTLDETGECEIRHSDNWDRVTEPNKTIIDNLLVHEVSILTNVKKIETIGENLNELMSLESIEMSGTDPNGNEKIYRLSLKGSLGQSLDKDNSKLTLNNPSMSYNTADELSLHWNHDNKLELMGYSDPPIDPGYPLARVLTDEKQANTFHVPIRYSYGNGARLRWMTVGNLDLPTNGILRADGYSLTTNPDAGAYSNAVSLYGFRKAPNMSVPMHYGTGYHSLNWTTFSDAFQIGASDDDASVGRIALNGESSIRFQDGDGGRRFFGKDRSYGFGFYKLPTIFYPDTDCFGWDPDIEYFGQYQPFSLRGFDLAETGMVPFKDAEGRLSWDFLDNGSGSALKVVGNAYPDNAETIGDGATTNTIRFASAADSNIKVEVSKSGDRTITVTIGVYYK